MAELGIIRKEPMQKNEVKQMSGLQLAYIGDCIYELLTRELVISKGNKPVNSLHKMTVSLVKAAAQSKAVGIIMDTLTEEETLIYKRGRNSEVGHIPKNGSVGDYHRATGLETLFGFLYLTGEMDRIKDLYEIITDNMDMEW